MNHLTMGIFAQVDAGKTTLSEAILYETGKLKKLGRVDHGNAFLDTHSIERARGITVFSKEARFSTGERHFTLLDTPGHVDFSPEAERVMQVLDYGILLISGTDGVQAHTETLWKLLRRYHIPTILFFNKMDLPGADRDRLLADVRKHLSEHCGDPTDGEALAMCDEVLLERFLEEGTVSRREAARVIAEEKFFPCYFGSALKLEGITDFLEALNTLTLPRSYGDTFCARVYKISRDPMGNRMTHLKVTGGSLKVRAPIAYKDLEEKVTQLRLYSGETYEVADTVYPGQVCALLGLSQTLPGDALGSEDRSAPPLLTPVMTYGLILPPGSDERVALQKLKQLEEEDPLLRIVWEERLRQIRIQLMGQVQLEVLQVLIRDRFGMEVTFDKGRVSYRETIAAPVEGVGHFEPLRHYAEVHLILEPMPRGSGLVLDTVCPEDSLDRNWQRLILTHLMEKTHVGVLTGSPITDMKLTLAAGRAHLKHTEGGDFRQATYRAVRQGLMQAESILLEPIYRFKLTVPGSQIGRAINDIRAMGGDFGSPEDDGENMILTGTAPVSEMQDYMSQVISYTRGKGKLLCTQAGYAPCHNQEAVIAAAGYDPEADTLNTPDSVFCSHGAGINIKWNEVPKHMHIESVLKPRKDPTPQLRTGHLDLDEKELQAIMDREFGPDKRVLYRPPTPVQAKEISLPPPKKEHLIVDGYNMIFAWEGLREQAKTDIDGARDRLLDLLSNYRGYRGCELVVVFDSYRVKGGTGSKTRHNDLKVVFTKEQESADLYIETLLGEIGRNYRIRVATSDSMIQLSALRAGTLRVSAQELLREIESVNESIARMIRDLKEESKRASIHETPMKKLTDPT